MKMLALFFDNCSIEAHLPLSEIQSACTTPAASWRPPAPARAPPSTPRHRHHQASALSRSLAPLLLSPAATSRRQRRPALKSIAASLAATVGVQASPTLSGSLKSARTVPDCKLFCFITN